MKRLLSLILVISLAFSCSFAQQLEGIWSAGKKFNKIVNKKIDDTDIKMSFGLLFGKTDVYALMILEAGMDEIQMECAFTVPGTYQTDGNNVVCTFKKNEIDFSLRDLKSTEPKLKTLLESEDTRQLTLQMFEGQIKDAMAEMMPGLADVTDLFSAFTIKEQSGNKMMIVLSSGEEVDFEKKD